MNVEKNEILFIYDSSDIQQREGLAYAKSLKHHKLKELDVQQESMTQLQLSNLASRLGLSDKELIKIDDEELKKIDLDEHDFLDYLAKNLSDLKTPIAVYSDHAKLLGTQYELMKEDGVNSVSDVQTSRTQRQREEQG